MKPEIHPKYYPQARVVCACGKTWTTGATQPEIRVDVCFNCHPFYTGEQRIVDTAGRVDRFRMRLAQKREEKVAKKVRKQRILVVNPDEKPEEAVAEAAAIVESAAPAESAPASELAPAPVAEPVAEQPVEDVEEVRVRTVLEDEAGALEVNPDDDRPRRRPAARKPRVRKTAPKAASTAAAQPSETAAEPKAEAAVAAATGGATPSPAEDTASPADGASAQS